MKNFLVVGLLSISFVGLLQANEDSWFAQLCFSGDNGIQCQPLSQEQYQACQNSFTISEEDTQNKDDCFKCVVTFVFGVAAYHIATQFYNARMQKKQK